MRNVRRLESSGCEIDCEQVIYRAVTGAVSDRHTALWPATPAQDGRMLPEGSQHPCSVSRLETLGRLRP